MDYSDHSAKQETFFQYLIFKSAFAAIVKIKPPATANTYQELRLTEEDKAIIIEIVDTLAKNGYYDLLIKHQTHLRAIGKKIEEVHPYKFLGYIFAHQELKEDMKIIFADYFKKLNFMQDLSKHLELENRKGTLMKFLQDFANEVNLPSEKIKPFIEKKDWDGLIDLLIYG